MELPNELRLALDHELRGADLARLAGDAAALSARYRERRAPEALSPALAAAYALVRMPATYGAAAAALGALAERLPGLAPASLLDAGAGTGAMLWAAAARWPALGAATLLERDHAMADMGRRLAARGRRPILGGAEWRRADLNGPWAAGPHDLVTAAYLLGELPEGRRAELVEKLWERASMALVLIEPGTPAGWATIRAAREQLRAAGAWLVAPCPHQGPCPMPADDWCHFAQRIERSRAHRAAKGAALGYEDEKYSYVAAARGPGDPLALRADASAIEARVLRRPLVRPGRVELTLCADGGLRRALVTRGDGEAWRLARDLRWGDPLPPGALDER